MHDHVAGDWPMKDIASRFRPAVVTNCPVCNYDLQGNRETRSCPECGFTIENGMVCYRPSGVLYLITPYAMGATLIFFAWLWWREWRLDFPNWSWYPRIFLGLAMLQSLAFFYRRIKYPVMHEYLITRRESIRWRIAGRPEEVVLWDEIKNVRASSFSGHVILVLASARHIVIIPRRFAPKRHLLNELIELIRHGAKRCEVFQGSGGHIL